jgi:chitinase
LAVGISFDKPFGFLSGLLGGTSPLPGFSVIGYYPYWSQLRPVQIPFWKFSHIIFSFINPTSTGGLVDVHFNQIAELAQEAHKYHVKVSIAIGGWQLGETRDWEEMASDPASLARFVKNVTKLCESYGIDGVDVDWEYPNQASSFAYAAMMKALAEALHARGRLLSAAVAVEPRHGEHILDEVLKHVDFLNIKAYDANAAHPQNPHSSYEYAEEGLRYWVKRGCPRKKAMLGVPFYGRTPVKTYREILAYDKEAAFKDKVGPVHYNGIPTIQRKTELAMKKGGGIMIWEISQDSFDRDSLLDAIHRKLAKK